MRRIKISFLCICLLLSLTACSVEKISKEKIRDIDFTVLKEEEIPKELWETIKEKGKNDFQISYADAGFYYVAIGYGEQERSGYSIEIKECYESDQAVYVHPNLIGPAKEEKSVETKTYPYVVIKFEYTDKHIIFV